jgi:hypothetical protein
MVVNKLKTRLMESECWYLIVAVVFLLPLAVFSQARVSVSGFKVQPWYKSVKLTWRATALQDSDTIFEIYRSDKADGPYSLVQEIKLGDKKFIDAATTTYVFFDKNVEVGRKYYYKLSLRGADQVFGPLQGIASETFPAT